MLGASARADAVVCLDAASVDSAKGDCLLEQVPDSSCLPRADLPAVWLAELPPGACLPATCPLPGSSGAVPGAGTRGSGTT